jgi:hypothetical protein
MRREWSRGPGLIPARLTDGSLPFGDAPAPLVRLSADGATPRLECSCACPSTPPREPSGRPEGKWCRVSVATYPADAASTTPRGAFPQRTDCRSQLCSTDCGRSRRVQLLSSRGRRSCFAPIKDTPEVRDSHTEAEASRSARKPSDVPMVEAPGTAPGSDNVPIRGSAPSFVANEAKGLFSGRPEGKWMRRAVMRAPRNESGVPGVWGRAQDAALYAARPTRLLSGKRNGNWGWGASCCALAGLAGRAR